MLADLETIFSNHDETIRRAEANYALIAATTSPKTPRPQTPPRGKLSALLRRLAGPAAA